MQLIVLLLVGCEAMWEEPATNHMGTESVEAKVEVQEGVGVCSSECQFRCSVKEKRASTH